MEFMTSYCYYAMCIEAIRNMGAPVAATAVISHGSHRIMAEREAK